MQRRIPINSELFKQVIKESGYTQKDLSFMFDAQTNYVARCLADEAMGEETLNKICVLIRRKPEDFIKKVEEKVETQESVPDKASIEAEISAVNDAMASLVKMMEVVQNNVKRLSDEVSTLKDTEYMAAQEAKRYYQTGNAFFKQVIGFLKGTRG